MHVAITAFGTAMLDQARGGGDVTINGQVSRGYCLHFKDVRDDEREMLDRLASKFPCVAARVLDMGCGIGRHVQEILRIRQQFRITGIERCDAMRRHCQAQFAGQRFLADAGQLGPGEEFDIILLLGNGLGILGGSADKARAGLEGLLARLSQDGTLVAESEDHPDPPGFGCRRAVISHGTLADAYDWGYASGAWVRASIPPGWIVESDRSHMPGPRGFFHEIRREVR